MNDRSSVEEVQESSAFVTALSWMVVLVPAAWGVYNTVLRAAHLFQ